MLRKNLVFLFLVISLGQGLMATNCAAAAYEPYVAEMRSLSEILVKDGSGSIIARFNGNVNVVWDGSNIIARNKEYTLWDLREIPDINSINNLTVRLKFWRNDTVIDIPIINGKPFGKDDKIQELSLERYSASKAE
jgi:hypothetical protein